MKCEAAALSGKGCMGKVTNNTTVCHGHNGKGLVGKVTNNTEASEVFIARRFGDDGFATATDAFQARFCPTS